MNPSKAALIIAHPGHELRVHGWLEQARPEVFVLTDGSGHQGVPRLASTAEVLRRAGARPGAVFGRFTDRAIYRIILERELDALSATVRELAGALAAGGVETVVCDAAEGFNPGHDLCRMLAGAAITLARRELAHPVVCRDFLLDGRPDGGAEELAAGALRLVLDDEALGRKLDAARSYPEMRYEVERNLAEHGEAAFRTECLRAADPEAEAERLVDDPPYYETYGERQVAAGHYDRVLRFREHFLPVAGALRDLARPA